MDVGFSPVLYETMGSREGFRVIRGEPKFIALFNAAFA